jgi:hypothetical protein
MDLKRGFIFPTRDPQWVVKVLIGTLITLVPILNFAAVGYAMHTSRNVYEDRETPLPEWNDFGGHFRRGFLGVVVQFLWSIPVLLVTCPFIFIIISSVDAEAGTLTETGGAAFICLPILMALTSLILTPFMMTAFTRYAVTNQFGEAMPGPVLREVRRNIRPWLLITATTIGLVMLATALPFCTFGFGTILIIPFVFYIQLVLAHWYAQAHQASTGENVAPWSMV